MARDPASKPTTLQTADRALRFLELIASADEPLAVRDVAMRLDLNLTTGYHLFNTLHQAGYLSRDSSGAIRLGSRIGLLYEGFRRQLASTKDLYDFVEALSKTTRETAYLSLLQGESLVVQAQIEAEQALRVAGHGVGFSGYEHLRAAGRAVMAYLDEDACSRMLDHLLTGTSKREAASIRRRLRTEFDLIRRQGWAVEHDEYQAGVCCVAAPLFDADGSIAGSISVSMPTGRYLDLGEAVTHEVVDTASAISRLRGFAEPRRGQALSDR